jgi:hypothetical protein
MTHWTQRTLAGAPAALCVWAMTLPSQAAEPLRIVSTPNPNVFPLLVALSRHPELPVELHPVPDAAGIARELQERTSDVLLAMTYTGAQLAAQGKAADLRLLDVTLWKGFSILAPEGVHSMAQLAGRGVLVSGPVGGGKGGGPDLILRAALRRAGQDPAGLNLCYLPVGEAVPLLLKQQPMSGHGSCSGNAPAAAISLAEPAATGLLLRSRFDSAIELKRAIPLEPLFAGFSAWPADELPHGGLAVRAEVLADGQRAASLTALRQAYREGADILMQARGNPLAMLRVAREVSAGVERWFGTWGMSLPMPVVMAALRDGQLMFHTDRPLEGLRPDLSRFLAEVVGAQQVPAEFLSSPPSPRP